MSCFDVLKKAGLQAKEAPTNDPEIRIGATDHWLGQLAGDGQAAYTVSTSCPHLIKALRGGYRFPMKTRSGTVGTSPDKNIFSHIAEANQYADMFFMAGLDSKHIKKLEYLQNKKQQMLEGYKPFDSEIGY